MTVAWNRNRLKFLLAGPVFETGNRLIPGRPHDRLAQLVAATRPQRVLELCGGTGYAARLLAVQLPDADIHSLDISPEMLSAGRRQLRRHSLNVTLHEADAGSLPFPDESFDVAMSVFGLHELPTDVRHRAVAETRRVLRPSGRVVVVDLDWPPTWHWAFHAYLRVAERRHAREVLGTGLADVLAAHGLSILDHQPAASWRAPFQTLQAYKPGRAE